jgi:hypothetical protein
VGHCCFLKLKDVFCLSLRVLSHGTSGPGGALCVQGKRNSEMPIKDADEKKQADAAACLVRS